jgi:hypothetical protein
MIQIFKLTSLLSALLCLAACASGEKDGRRYTASNAFPIGSKMGTSYRYVNSSPAPAGATPKRTIETDGVLGVFLRDHSNDPPGLFDRHSKPDEPDANYRLQARQSPNPVASKMGVRVTRVKK